MIVREAPPEHYDWIAQRADLCVRPGFRAMEVVDGERILGMVAYDGWLPNCCSMHLVLEAPIAARLLIKYAFRVPFVKAGLGVVVGTVRSTNERALRLNRHLGFREIFRGKNWMGNGVDLVWMEMRKDECRYLGDDNG